MSWHLEGRRVVNMAECEDPTTQLWICDKQWGAVGYNFRDQKLEKEVKWKRKKDTHRIHPSS